MSDINRSSGVVRLVTPSDSEDLIGLTRSVMVTTAGVVNCIMEDGQTVPFPALIVGYPYPIRCTRILATDTVATGIVALF